MAELEVLEGVATAGEAVTSSVLEEVVVVGTTLLSRAFSDSRDSSTGVGFSSMAATTGAADRGDDSCLDDPS
jgi:hypothetical protein